MFQKCSKIDKVCGFCAFSTYDPISAGYGSEKIEFCGIASSYDCRVSSLPDCWLKMTKSQRSVYTRKKKEECQTLIISGRR